MTKGLLIGLIFCGLLNVALAQRPGAKVPPEQNRISSNLHRKFIPVSSATLKLDSLSLVPGSFSVAGIGDSTYTVDYVHSTLSWKRKPNLDSVYVKYRSFPYQLNGVVQRLRYEKVMDKFIIQPSVYSKDGKYGSDNFFNFGNITYNGSFGRAISFGNSQDAVVTSNLNLQISGYLADSIEISAAITDNNIPIQPDGTTAELNDFDRIYLKFKKKNWALSMGDIDLRQTQNYFLNFYKRLRGGSFETVNKISDHVTNKTLVSGAVAKGKFTRNVFQGLEGNQGPYRLKGANNELYFIVLSGTEKVYIDGELLQRGEDQDYVINYNTAELTFTPKRMITKDSRIQIEFEYSDQYFLNANLYLYNEALVNKNLKIRFGVFNNSDARNSPITQTLDQGRKTFLNALGDSVNRAFYPLAPVDTAGPAKILYRRVDTVYRAANGLYTHDSVYVFSADPTHTLYNLSFVDVGVGKGNYIPDPNGTNGNVYKWVPPTANGNQGQFEAAEFLVTPKTQQVITLGADYNVNKETTVSTDLARSRYDINTLSNIDKGNDVGNAAKITVKNLHPFQHSSHGLELGSALSYEYVDARFQPLERLRPVEYLRDWGLPLQMPQANETFYNAAFKLNDKKKNDIRYELAGYNRGSSFTGIRNTLGHTLDLSGWRFSDQLSWTTDRGDVNNGYLLRPVVDISKTLKQLKNYTMGFNYSMEHNEQRNKINDSVSLDSYSFSIVQAYLKSPEKNANKWGATYFYREDAYPYGKELARANRSQNINVYTDLTKNKHEQLRINATYRSLEVINAAVTTQQPDKSLLARAEYSVNEWKGLLTGNALYEVGSGQEQKQAYTYISVPAGTGQYTWIDLNNDGIQQLNEFVIAQYADQASFVRVFTPTNQYVKANYNTFNYSLALNPRMLLGNKAKGFKKLLSNLFLQTSLQLNQKQQATGFVQLNPFKSPLNDTSLITRSSVLVNSFSVNKLNPKWGFDISNNQNSSKALLTYGYQTQSIKEWNLRTRWNLSRSFLFTSMWKKGTNYLLTNSTNFDNSNYSVNQYSVEPDISYTQRANLRITLGYKYSAKKNEEVYGGESYYSGALNTDAKYNIVQSTSLQAKFTYSNIHYTGATNSTVSYIMLDALLPGKNYLWNLDLTKKLGNNLELSIQYEGRKPGEGHTIHTGRASLRAIL
ncbi:MAG: hypothetical protein Q8918_05980 [Bacteroidota bacterium]|nr:hypothetical protein [Bacteroidota bacterium]